MDSGVPTFLNDVLGVFPTFTPLDDAPARTSRCTATAAECSVHGTTTDRQCASPARSIWQGAVQAGTCGRPRRQGLTADGSGADQRLPVELTLTAALGNCPRTCISYTDALSPSVLVLSSRTGGGSSRRGLGNSLAKQVACSARDAR